MKRKLKKKMSIIVVILVMILILVEALLMNFCELKMPIAEIIYFSVITLVAFVLVILSKKNPSIIFEIEHVDDSQKLGFITDPNITLELLQKENLRDILKTDLKCRKNDEVTIVFYAKKATERCHLYFDYSSYECEEFKCKTILAKKIAEKTYVFKIKLYSKGIFSIKAVQFNKGTEIKNNQQILLTVKTRY